MHFDEIYKGCNTGTQAVAAQSDQDAANTQVSGAQISRPPIMQIYIAQLVALITASSMLLLQSKVAAYSALIGGLVSVIPNAYFSRWAFRYSGARSAAYVTRSFYRGEAGKFVLTASLFAAIFVLLKPLNFVVFFLAYIFMMALNWILALRLLNKNH
jgi:ATP synthase protein I